jgi:hypothetical protein
MVVADLTDATVAVALDDRTIGTERAGLARFAHGPAAEDHPAVRVFVSIHQRIVANRCANSMAPGRRAFS